MRRHPGALAGLILGLGFAADAFAHDVDLTRVVARFEAGRYQVDLHYDVDAWIVEARPGHLDEEIARQFHALSPADLARREQQLRDFVLRRVRIRFDAAAALPEVTFPPSTEAAGTQPAGEHRMRRILRLSGPVPRGAGAFDFWASRTFGRVVLLVYLPGVAAPQQYLLDMAERSRPVALARAEAAPGWREVAAGYLRLGFEHILPKGLDHILFVLGLFLLSDKLGPLLWQVTAFTLAHTLTLALSSYGVISMSPRVVEPLIALSIAYVGIENVCTPRLHAWRPIVVFLFGLLHGMGFAGVLSELGLPRSQFAVALVSFNAGVELGQATVILLAFAAVGRFRRRPWYRRRIVVPASLAISATGLYWAVVRMGG